VDKGVDLSPLVEKKPKPDGRSRKQSYAFYLSKGLVDDINRIAKDTGRSKSEVLEILANAGIEIHLNGGGTSR
jgi:hypothetical protein